MKYFENSIGHSGVQQHRQHATASDTSLETIQSLHQERHAQVDADRVVREQGGNTMPHYGNRPASAWQRMATPSHQQTYSTGLRTLDSMAQGLLLNPSIVVIETNCVS